VLARRFPLLLALLAPVPAQDYARDVEPILQAHCVRCHGPERQRKSLRLDAPAGILAGGRSGFAVIPGDSARSRLLRHVRGDGVRRMPPEGEALGEQQIATLAAWIDQGARVPQRPEADLRHWAYRAPQALLPPDVRDPHWCRNPVDRFVRSRLESEGLAPAPAAAREVLLRRASLDLIGLPPTPQETAAFVADRRPDAFERAVDRLLASPHFGERWAQMWLDLARYADTKGYEKDDRRTIWPYRDWVIRAFDADMPFDRFTIEQLAGDLLPEPGDSQLVATAFHRNTMTNDEGGTDDEEFRVEAVLDRVNTTLQVWNGTTVGCAQCHDHKYDPISQREYYALFAVFNTTQDADRPDEQPTLPVLTDPRDRVERERLQAELARLETALQAATPELEAAFGAWRAGQRAQLAAHAARNVRSSTWRTAGPFADANRGAALAAVFPPERDPGTADWRERGDWVDGQVHTDLTGDNSAHYLRRTITADAAGPLTLSLGSDDALKVWVNGVEVLARDVTRAAAADQERVTVELRAGDNDLLLKIVNGGGPCGFYFATLPVDVSAKALELLRRDDLTGEPRAELEREWRGNARELAEVRAALAQARAKLAEFAPVQVPILREQSADARRPTFVHVRGSFLNRGEPVAAGVPAVLPPLPAGDEPARLRFARWLVSADHPLTARVAVNRFWEQLFGRGLVETSEDFGTQGEPPSHPELLDWLARRFVDGGWSVKALLRTIVTSATYRQDSVWRADLAEIDPTNRLLARGPRLRLPAETIRDQALAVSGLLDRARFGPSVMPPQPDGIWRVVYSNDQWQTSAGGDRYRRGLYTFWRRTSPYPSMVAFDAPSREFCVVRRVRTNTPLQALVTLNDPVYVEAAQALAGRMDADRDPLARGFALCLQRAPTPAERRVLERLFEQERAQYLQRPQAAAPMAGGRRDGDAGTARRAALAVVANVLLNLDAFLTRS
jgi:mono/diheme cytochrome c family protein